jgi:hypothetical protein
MASSGNMTEPYFLGPAEGIFLGPDSASPTNRTETSPKSNLSTIELLFGSLSLVVPFAQGL